MSTVSQASICVTRGLKVYPKGGETVRPDGPRATYMSKGTSVPLALGQCLLMILASIGGSNIMKNSHCQVPLLNSCILTLFLLNCYLVSLSWGRRGNIFRDITITHEEWMISQYHIAQMVYKNIGQSLECSKKTSCYLTVIQNMKQRLVLVTYM